jgi:hypothetical protein
MTSDVGICSACVMGQLPGQKKRSSLIELEATKHIDITLGGIQESQSGVNSFRRTSSL